MHRDNDEYEHSIIFGEKALSSIRKHRTSAQPRTYELWFTYALGHNSGLNKALDAAASKDGGITRLDIEEIYDSYLSPLRFSDKVDQVGARLIEEIDRISVMVEGAVDHTTAYGKELAAAALSLSAAGDAKHLPTVIQSLVRMTHEMEAANRHLTVQLAESHSEIKNMQESLHAVRTESLTDPLTSLSNRKAFDLTLQIAITHANLTGEPFALMMTDIDHFKRFNDNYGHLTGDQVLRLVALAVKQNVKGADMAARFGGEEFAVILPNTVLRSALTVAEHIRRAVMSKELVKRSTNECLGRVTISIGVAVFRPGDTAHNLIERADICLYAAKRGGRNRVVCEVDPEFELQAAVA